MTGTVLQIGDSDRPGRQHETTWALASGHPVEWRRRSLPGREVRDLYGVEHRVPLGGGRCG